MGDLSREGVLLQHTCHAFRKTVSGSGGVQVAAHLARFHAHTTVLEIKRILMVLSVIKIRLSACTENKVMFLFPRLERAGAPVSALTGLWARAAQVSSRG